MSVTCPILARSTPPVTERIAESGVGSGLEYPESKMERQQAHQLLDQLGPEQFDAVARLLEVLAEPLSHSLRDVTVDEEELTPEMAAALDRARAALAEGKGVAHEEVLRESGLRG